MNVKRWKLGWKRCDCVKCEAALTIEQTEENCGWVKWEDHKDEVTRLKAEVDALKLGSLLTAVDVLQFIKLKEEVERLRASSFVTAVPVEEYEKLKAENERLRKAGDNLARAADENGCHDNGDAKDLDDSIDRWYAAKEGKQP